MNFLQRLKERNTLLYWFGWYNLIAGVACIVFMFADHTQILGVSRWIKPAKFFFSVAVMIWTMNWLLYYLDNLKAVRIVSWLFVVTMFVENTLISIQAIRGVPSHFNISDAFNGMLFGIMGGFIMLFTVTCIYALVLFFRQKIFTINSSYLWGIRLGLLLFIVFSLEGGVMVALMSHTVGGKDGQPGLPFLNWSMQHGDLRIAHFLGLHSLQVLPLAGYYLAKNKKQVMLYSTIYFIIVVAILLEALKGIPLLS